MFLASASTKRPIAMTCLILALIGLGLNAYRKLSIENIPAIDIPYVTVQTIWSGASAEDIEKDVTKHIEDAVAGIDGLKHTYSSSLENVSFVVLEFNLGTSQDTAAQDVREKVDAVLSELPDAADRPIIQKMDINASVIATLFLSGEAPLDELYDYADNTLADRFASVPGVAKVELRGGNEREVWIELDRDRLAAAGLTTADVVGALGKGIASIPGGHVIDSGSEYSVRFDAEYEAIPDIAGLEVAAKDGMRRRIGDLGTVRSATEEVRTLAYLDGKAGIVLTVTKKAEGNIVKVVEETRERFEQLQGELPGGMRLDWVFDESDFIVNTVDSTISSIAGAVVLCAIILFLFLVNLRSTIIVVITMPVTILISLFFLQVAGQTLNMVTLTAIGLSTGVLVSNSIVVLENIVSKLETEHDPWKAACDGASEVAVAVLASAGTNVIVMLPIGMMTSMVGRVLAPFAIATLIVNAVSILISFTLTPILSALLLRPVGPAPSALRRLGIRWAGSFEAFGRFYSNRVLRPVARRRWIAIPIILGFVALFVGTLKFGAPQLGFSFMESADNGRVFIRVECPPYYDLEKSNERIQAMCGRILGELPDIRHVVAVAGYAQAMSGQASEGVYLGQIEIFFTPKTERDWSIVDKLPEIREMFAQDTDVMVSASTASMMGGQNFNIEQILTGPDLDTLDATALAVQGATRDLPGIAFLETTVRDSKPELRVVPKRTVLADLAFPATTLGSIVRGNIEGIEAASFKRGDRTYDIRVKLAETEGRDQIRQFLLPGAAGRPIALESVADVVDSRSKIQVYRADKQRAVKLLGDVLPGAAMSDVNQGILRTVDEQKLLPPGYTFMAGGAVERLGDAVADFGEAILLAIFLTLLTLCAILESWSRPALVLLTLPMAIIGVVWALVAGGYNMTIFVLLGMLMLIGIVVNAAILIVDQAARHVASGMPRRETMLAAIVDQFRPVLMVVLASGLGMLPMAISKGIGSEMRAGIGWASVAGILVAGVLTIVVIPLLYNLFAGKPERGTKR